MRERLKALRQLLHVYEAIEEMREVESQRAAIEVREAEQAIGRQRTISQVAALDGHQALLGGDRMGWSFAAVQQEAAGWRETQLAGVLSEREECSGAARRQHLDSRQWSERMKRLVDGATASVTETEEKRTQAAADDRYLSRRRWKQGRRRDDASRR
jgi:hypothetical protein